MPLLRQGPIFPCNWNAFPLKIGMATCLNNDFLFLVPSWQPHVDEILLARTWWSRLSILTVALIPPLSLNSCQHAGTKVLNSFNYPSDFTSLYLPAWRPHAWFFSFNFSRKFKVSIESLIFLKSSSSSVSGGIEESSRVHLVADLSERAAHNGILSTFLLLHSQMSQGRFMSDPLSPTVCPYDDVKGKGKSTWIDGPCKFHTMACTHTYTFWKLLKCSTHLWTIYCKKGITTNVCKSALMSFAEGF